jgi:uncharacterized membrane protein YgcG
VSDPVYIAGMIGGAFALAIFAALLRIPGWLFRSRIDWGVQAAALLMIPAFCISFAAAAFIWFGAGPFELPWAAIAGIAACALWLSNSSISFMKSRQSAGAIAFRKRLAAGRRFFMKELEKPRPNLSDRWYPWLIAFGLARQVDYWSSHNTSAAATTDSLTSSATDSSSSGASAATGWSGGGGLSGGAGATGMWAAAAAGMAAGVAAPDSSSAGGGSSSGGSSGGGGGGGW